jgi:hypothetical protein
MYANSASLKMLLSNYPTPLKSKVRASAPQPSAAISGKLFGHPRLLPPSAANASGNFAMP